MLSCRFKYKLGLYAKNGKNYVRIRVTSWGDKVDLYSRIAVPKEHWNSEKGCIDENYENMREINSLIEKQISFIREFFRQRAESCLRPSLSVLHQEFNQEFKH